MRAFERRQNSASYMRRFALRSLAAVVLFLVMVFCARGAWGMYQRFTIAGVEARTAQAHLQSLLERKTEVASAVEALSTDRGIEAEVRERYGVAKPGEGKIEIVRNTALEASTTPAAQATIFSRAIKALFSW